MRSSMEEMIFLDTSFLVALEVETDQNHIKAVEVRDKIIEGNFGNAIISDYVFDETLTATLQKTRDLEKAVIVGENLRNSLEIINLEPEILEEAWNLFKYQKQTIFSFTDCTILVIMRGNAIKNIATFDKDFLRIKDIKVIH